MPFGLEAINRVRGEAGTLVTLSPALPAVVFDPGDGTARVRILSGVAVTAEIDEGEIGVWAQAGVNTLISAQERRAYVRVGRDHVVLAVTWL